MALIDDLIASVSGDAAVRDVRVGVFSTAVLSAGCGLAATMPKGNLPHGEPLVRDAGSLRGQSAGALLPLAKSDVALERSIGVAALNSLLPVDVGRGVDLNAGDLLLDKGRGKRVALVGHFPFVPGLRQVVAQLSVLELRPQAGDLPAAEAERVIPEAEVVAITGSALINGTVDYLLGLCAPDAFVVVVGPSTPLSPIWFQHDVDVVSGTLVTDPDLVLRLVSEGATFRQLRGIRLLTIQRSFGNTSRS